MKIKYSLYFLFLLSPFYLLQAQETRTNLNYQQKAQQLLIESVQQKNFMGVAGGISVDGHTAWASGVGFSNKQSGQEFSPNTLTRPASLAKPMTAIAIMQLVEKGIIDLDAPIQTYLKDFPVKKEGVITTRQILQHGSGIKGYEKKESETRTNYSSLTDAVNIFKDRDLVGIPGKTYYYSSYAYVVLGLIIEKTSGFSYGDYMQKNIWTPAGMKNTGIENLQNLDDRHSKLYKSNGKGKLKLVKKPNSLTNRIPGGGLYTTVEDMLRFGEAVIQNKLISKASMTSMLENSGLVKEGNPYGLGWTLYGENPKYGNVFGHAGAQTGSSCQLMILPERSTSIAILANTSGSWKKAVQLSIDLFDIAAEARQANQ